MDEINKKYTNLTMYNCLPLKLTGSLREGQKQLVQFNEFASQPVLHDKQHENVLVTFFGQLEKFVLFFFTFNQ